MLSLRGEERRVDVATTMNDGKQMSGRVALVNRVHDWRGGTRRRRGG